MTTLSHLIAMGFSRAAMNPESRQIWVGCDSCEATVIQGVPCHERGCPDEMHECKGCNSIISKRQRYCEDCA